MLKGKKKRERESAEKSGWCSHGENQQGTERSVGDEGHPQGCLPALPTGNSPSLQNRDSNLKIPLFLPQAILVCEQVALPIPPPLPTAGLRKHAHPPRTHLRDSSTNAPHRAAVSQMDGTQTSLMFSPRCKNNPRMSPRNGSQTCTHPNYCFAPPNASKPRPHSEIG